MNILIVGNSQNVKEITEKFGTSHTYLDLDEVNDVDEIENCDVIFDFDLEENPDRWELYHSLSNGVLFVNVVKTSLSELFYLHDKPSLPVYGFNGLPTFVVNDIFETSAKDGDDDILKSTFERLGSEYLVVNDRVGMVTPRIIFMIINEAYFTVQEGTATKADIDQGMKLGTNYPYGPFEWAELIGINHIYEVLEALYEDTHDERYKICPLLKREYLETNA